MFTVLVSPFCPAFYPERTERSPGELIVHHLSTLHIFYKFSVPSTRALPQLRLPFLLASTSSPRKSMISTICLANWTLASFCFTACTQHLIRLYMCFSFPPELLSSKSTVHSNRHTNCWFSKSWTTALLYWPPRHCWFSKSWTNVGSTDPSS